MGWQMTPELLKTAEAALEKLAQDGVIPPGAANVPNASASGRPATPINTKGVLEEAKRLKNSPLEQMAFKAQQYWKRPGRLGSALWRPFNALFSTAGGNALLTAALGYSQMADQLAPKVMSKFKFASVNSNNGSKTMKTLKDVLVEKIAAARRPASTQPSNLPFTVGQADVDFVNKIAAALPNAMEKTAGINWISEAAQGAMPALQLGALGAMTGMAASGIYDRVSDYMKRNAAYDQMFNEFPMLNEVPREQVDKFWGVLNDFAPKLATNPIVAGQFVENMLNYGVKGIDHNVAQQLLQSEATARNAGGRDIFELLNTIGKSSFDAGAKSMSGDPT